jgi:hypothetical protein
MHLTGYPARSIPTVVSHISGDQGHGTQNTAKSRIAYVFRTLCGVVAVLGTMSLPRHLGGSWWWLHIVIAVGIVAILAAIIVFGSLRSRRQRRP